MNYSYKSDIIEKVFQFIAIVYFVFGLIINYAWACKELDFITDIGDILRFWEPIAGVSGVLSTVHVILIVYSIYIGIKASSDPDNPDINLLFYILSVPLFIVTVVYMTMLIVRDIMIVQMIGYFTVFMRFGHLALFCGTMMFIVLFNYKKPIISTPTQKLLVRFVTLITILEMIIYFMFHLISQQVHTFVRVSSVNSTYRDFYNPSIVNRTGDPFQFNSIQNYLQPLVILFCCVCAIYLIIMNSFNDENELNAEKEMDNEGELVNLLGSEPSIYSKSTDINDSVNKHIFQSLRLPPLSLVLGILLVTVFLLVIVIVNGLISSEPFGFHSRMVSSIFLIFIYILSMILMSIQINEMKRWQVLKENKNVVNKILIWVGIPGQLIISMEMIQVNFYHYNDMSSGYEILQFFILTFQALMQYIVLSLALDRKWVAPDIKTWQEYICPAVGMLSINLGLLAFSIFDVMPNFTNQQEKLFLNLFSVGIQSFGVTLLIIQRMHVSLIFGHMVIVTNSLN